MKVRHLELHDSFCSNVKTFMALHDLLSYSSYQRDVTMKNSIQQLTLKEKQLQEKLSVYSQHQNKVDMLQIKAERIKMHIQVNMKELEEVERLIEKEKGLSEKLEQQKQNISNIPHTSQDYLRLREELARCKDETLEDYCAVLQCELQELQQKLWQKNIRVKQTPKPAAHNTRAIPPVGSIIQQRFTNYGSYVSKATTFRPKPE